MGFISYDVPIPPTHTWFEFEYIGTTLASLREASEKTPETFPTPAGEEVRAKITAVREMFSLDEVLGCTPPGAPERFRRGSSLDQPDSLSRDCRPIALLYPPSNERLPITDIDPPPPPPPGTALRHTAPSVSSTAAIER